MAKNYQLPAQISQLIEGRRVFIFSGHAGSGKTEVAINFALGLSSEAPTSIVDFDVINPYFRTADASATLEAAGVRLVAPPFAGTNVDVPALPGEIHRLFDDTGARAVFDVGGDDLGAKAVSSFRESFLASGAMHFFVFNERRPMTSTPEKAERAFHEIQASARVPFDAIANNTHILGDTTPGDLLGGLDAALDLAGRVGVPVAFSSLMLPCGAVDGASCVASKASSEAAPEAASEAGSQGVAAYAGFLARLSDLGIPVFWLRKHITMEYH